MTAPALSVILLVPLEYARVQKTLGLLRAQTCVANIELVLVTFKPLDVDWSAPPWQAFHAVKIIRVAENATTGEARARGVDASTASIIAFIEDHVFPSLNWAETLLGAHSNPYAAVAVQMENGNPSGISWADMLLSFGNWIAPAVRGTMTMLPGHNTSYKREVLCAYGERLGAMMDSEAVMHQDLVQRGSTLFLETHASIRHLNIALWEPFLRHKFLGGRIFGAVRATSQNWSWTQRLVYACGGGLIPLVRFWRMLPDVQRTGASRTFGVGFGTALILGLIVHAVGEVLGYVVGAGDSLPRYLRIETNRFEHLRPEDRALAFE